MSFSVFISYDSREIDTVNLLAQVLEWNNIIPLVAELRPEPGRLLWKEKIEPMIRRCQYFVVFLTRNSIGNSKVNQEIGAASILGKRIFILLSRLINKNNLVGFLEGLEFIPNYDSLQPHYHLNSLVWTLLDKYSIETGPILGRPPPVIQFYGCHPNYGKTFEKVDETTGKWIKYRIDSKNGKWQLI